jgi:4-diphosphocytidyl-2-C-methyl-D-erythritol kinase
VAKVKLDSFAKVNLLLSVRPRRRDNYHGITTVFQRISLKDTITLQSRKDNLIKITTNDRKLACGKTNFVWQAVELLRKMSGLNRGLSIRITKRIPLGSGMGGGSSNAASVLVGLNRLWGLGFSQRRLSALGAKIGSDVPFFIYNCPFAIGRGRGEKITPLKRLKNAKLWQVIVIPGINVSTALIYRKWDQLKSLRLTRGKSNVKLISLALEKNDISLLNRAISNSLEPVTEKLFPEVKRTRQRLFALGLRFNMMSGSGPAVFSIVSSKKEALSFQKRIRKLDPLAKVLVAQTC